MRVAGKAIATESRARHAEAAQGEAGDRAERDREREQMEQRAGDLAAGDRGVDRLQPGLNGNSRDDADHVEEPPGTAPDGTSARNAIGQREQRARAARRRGPPARARRSRRPSPRSRAPPRRARPATPAARRVERHERARPNSISSAARTRTAPPAPSSPPAGRARDEAAHQPRERVLLPLEREHAGREQERHEHQRDRHGDRDREGARASVSAPLTTLGFTSTGEPIALRIGFEMSRLSAASGRSRDLLERVRSGASSGIAADRGLDDRARARRPRMSTSRPGSRIPRR